MAFLIDEDSIFSISGGHVLGDGWVNFNMTGSFFKNLSKTLKSFEKKAAVVGSEFVGNTPYGCPITMTASNSSCQHQLNGKKILTSDSGIYTIKLGWSGYGVFSGWKKTNPNFVIE